MGGYRSSFDVLVLAAVAAVLIVVATSSRRDISNPSLTLFRVLLPSWRFFEQVPPAPRLMCRFAGPRAELGPWHELLRSTPRSPAAWLFNPRGNLRFACLSVLEHLQSELEAMPPEGEPSELIAYQLVRSIVLDELTRLPEASRAERYQFCIAQPGQGETHADESHLLVSEIHHRAA